MTNTYLAAMVTLLEAHTWVVTEPERFIHGPIPQGLLVSPAIAVRFVSGEEPGTDDELASNLAVETVEWAYAKVPELVDQESDYLELMSARNEMRAMIIANRDWGIEAIEDTHPLASALEDATIYDLTTGQPVGMLLIMRLSMEVRYYVTG